MDTQFINGYEIHLEEESNGTRVDFWKDTEIKTYRFKETEEGAYFCTTTDLKFVPDGVLKIMAENGYPVMRKMKEKGDN